MLEEQFLNLFFPKICGICGKISKQELCPHCRIKINQLKQNKKHIYLTKFYSTHFYIFDYQDLIRERLIEYKFYNHTHLLKTFVKIVLNDKKICGFLKSYDIIIPVPISKKRKKQRGYNQSELITKNIAQFVKGIEYQNQVLYKVKETLPQSKLDKKQRKENIQGAYIVKNGELIYNKRILLLDDIYTTGSTVNECSKILKEVGAKEIGVLTLAKD